MLYRARERYQTLLAVGRQFTHLVRETGSVESGLDALNKIALNEQKNVVESLAQASRDGVSNVDKDLGPYAVLITVIETVKREGGDYIAVLSGFDKMLRSMNEQASAIWVTLRDFVVYLSAVFMVVIVVSLNLMFFVVPQFQSMFDEFGAKLPLLTEWLTRNNGLMFFSMLIIYISLLAGFILTALHLFRSIANLQSLNSSIKNMPILMPVIKTYQRMLSINYAMILLDSGVTATRALTLSSELSGDTNFASVATGQYASLSNQDVSLAAIALAMKAENLPAELDYQLNDLSYRLAADLNMARQKTLMFFYILLACFVGLFVIAMYLPIFKLGAVA